MSSTRERWLGPAVAAAVLGAGTFVYRRSLPVPAAPVAAPARTPPVAALPARPAPPPEPAPGPKPPGRPAIGLVEAAEEAGLRFTHKKPVYPASIKNIEPWLASIGVSVAVADVDGDGRPDVFVSNTGAWSRNALFHNNGDGTFRDVTDAAGLGSINNTVGSMRALFFDWDNDGFPDLVLTTNRAPVFFHNRRDGTFADVSASAGVTHAALSYASNAVDLDGDGDLDLVIADYFPPVNLLAPERLDFMQNSMTDADNGGDIIAYENDGHGHFTPFPGNLGIKSRGWTQAVGVWDVDGNGLPDLYFATDYGNDQLYLNRGKGRFEDASKTLENKYSRSGMNADFADLDGDGRASVYVTHIYAPPFKLGGNTLWTFPRGGGRPRERAADLEVGECGWAWGAKFVDLDLDGRLDLVVTNGYISANPDKDYWYSMGVLAGASRKVAADARNWPAMGDSSMSGYEHKCVFQNAGARFKDVAEATGMRDDVSDGRGLAVIDAQSDGRPSLLEASQGSRLRYYKGAPPPGNRWIGFALRGTVSNRDAWGARVTLHLKGGRQARAELEPGNGFVSQSDGRLLFGLGPNGSVVSAEVVWPSGAVTRLSAPAAGRYHPVVEPSPRP